MQAVSVGRGASLDHVEYLRHGGRIRPGSIACAPRPLEGGIGVPQMIEAVQLLLHDETFDLERCRPRQVLSHDFEACDSLERRKLGAKRLDFVAKILTDVHDATCAKCRHIRHHHREQFLRGGAARPPADYADLLDQRGTFQVPLDLLGVDVPPAVQDDHVLAATGNAQLAILAEEAEIAGHEPAVAERRSSRVRPPVIAACQRRSAQRNFTFLSRLTTASRGRKDRHRNTWNGKSYSAQYPSFPRAQGNCPGRFGQSVTLQHIKAETIESLFGLAVQHRSAGNKKSHLWAAQGVYIAKYNRAEIEAHMLADEAARNNQKPCCCLGDHVVLQNFARDPFVEQMEEQWHAAHRGDSAFPQRPPNLSRA